MKLVVDRRLTPLELATAFCELDDEAQAQFFIEAARIAETWREDVKAGTSYGPGWQWYSIGRHLKTCSCSTEEAREMVREISRAASQEDEPR